MRTEITLLLDDILRRAKALGWSQKELAARAGLREETISRAKKRGTVDTLTLAKLTQVLGAGLVVTPEPVDPLSGAEARHAQAGLRDAKWMLAWSNPNIDDDVLIRKALLSARFSAILQACLDFGVARVAAQWVSISQDRPVCANLVSDILANIERGRANAQS